MAKPGLFGQVRIVINRCWYARSSKRMFLAWNFLLLGGLLVYLLRPGEDEVMITTSSPVL